jgi:hypothetical protein
VRKKIPALLAAAVIGTLSATTMLSPASAAAPAAACLSGRFCIYPQVNYGGTPLHLADRPNGTCSQLWNRFYSFQNRSNFEGYFYRYGDCTGQARAAVRGGSVPDMGFPATGFRYACVSCRELP